MIDIGFPLLWPRKTDVDHGMARKALTRDDHEVGDSVLGVSRRQLNDQHRIGDQAPIA
jgi:hypothetical protein